MNVGGGGGLKSEINVTPLVDVVLVLLIIFMVITPLLQMGYQVSTPPEVKSDVPPPVSGDQIIVRLDRDGRMFINKEAIAAADFGRRLDEAMHNRESKVVFFAADGGLPFGQVADFLDICRNNGAQNLGIVFEDLKSTPVAASALGVAP
jgi:biopolymer transport protein ExbD